MSFEKTKAVAQHSEEEVEQEVEEVKPAEETATEAPQSEEQTPEAEEETSNNEDEESEPQESVEDLKDRLAKAERDRDNYKQGLLSKKAKERLITTPEHDSEVEINEQVVMEVLEKQQEKSALKNTIDPKHSDYIPELVDDFNYNEIISFLPRNVDKSDYNSIVKSLKLATKIWKEEKGIKDKPATGVNIPSPKTMQAKESKVIKQPNKKTFFKPAQKMEDWYSK